MKDNFGIFAFLYLKTMEENRRRRLEQSQQTTYPVSTYEDNDEVFLEGICGIVIFFVVLGVIGLTIINGLTYVFSMNDIMYSALVTRFYAAVFFICNVLFHSILIR